MILVNGCTTTSNSHAATIAQTLHMAHLVTHSVSMGLVYQAQLELNYIHAIRTLLLDGLRVMLEKLSVAQVCDINYRSTVCAYCCSRNRAIDCVDAGSSIEF